MIEPTQPVTEERARRILARAMDAQSRELTTVQDLEVIARELGISAEAFHAALRDENADASGDVRRSGWVHKVLIGAGLPIGFATGWILTTSGFFYGAMPVAALTAAGLTCSAALIGLERRGPTPHRFVFRNTVLWAGVAAGSLAAIAMAGSQSVIELPWIFPILASVRNWFVSSMLGAVAVAAMRSSTAASDSADDDSPQREPAGMVRRLVRAVRRVFDETVQRSRFRVGSFASRAQSDATA